MPAGVVVAAGGSTRTGAVPKALLPHPEGGTALRRVVRALEAARCSPIIVVLGAHVDILRPEVEGTSARVVLRTGWARGRTGSVKQGLREVLDPKGTVLLWPVDHPFASIATLRALAAAAPQGEASPNCWVVPVHEGRRGHPVLLGGGAAQEVLRFGDDEPLFRYPRSHPQDVIEVAVDDPGVLENVDTLEAFERAADRHRKALPRDPPAGSD